MFHLIWYVLIGLISGVVEIGDARAHDDLLDDRARHHRIDHRRRRYPHVFARGKPTISSRRHHFFAAVDGESFACLPAPDGAFTAIKVAGNLLPRFQSLLWRVPLG